MNCAEPECALPAKYYISGVITRGKVEFPGIDNGGFFYAVPVSSTGTETNELSEYACEEHSRRAYVRSTVTAQNAADRLAVARGQQEASPLGPWRLTEFKRERLPQ